MNYNHLSHVPKIFIALTFLFAALLVIGDSQTAVGQTSPPDEKYLTGFAWSSNIGWISLRGSLYGVDLSPSGDLSGFGWSSNVGWISFNESDLAGCPSGSCKATINTSTGAVTGWARICSGTILKNCKGQDRTDGFDGWVELSGTNHPSPDTSGAGGVTFLPSTSKFVGFAWGSEVIGWIDFNNVSVATNRPFVVEVDTDDTEPPVITTFKMIPNTVNKNQSCTMNWEVENADSCTIIGQGYTDEYKVSLPSGSDKTVPITAATRYTLSCGNSVGTVTKDAICRINATLNEQ